MSGLNLYSWMERTSEIEFLLDVHGQILPIEVKSGWVTKAKSLIKFIDKYSLFKLKDQSFISSSIS